MSKIYYIDSENVGDTWIELLSDTEADSKILVFYTSHSPRIAYPQAIQLMNAVNKPEFILCHEGNNGLDFQLITYLGYQLHADSSNEMVIVSNDTGFDAAIEFWKEREMNVSRLTKANILPEIPEPTLPVSSDEIVVASSPVEKNNNIEGVDIRELYTIINCIGTKDTSFIHLAFVHFYDNKKGKKIYVKCYTFVRTRLLQ